MNLAKIFPALCMAATAAALFAQFPTVPTLITPPNIQYPPIAKAAHVQGEVVVTFTIDYGGRTVSVQTLSGPAMLRHAVEDQIKQWQFKLPLSFTQDDFKATYTFKLDTSSEEDLDDDLDAPPYRPCCGDSISITHIGSAQVTGEVISTDGNQKIDVTGASAVSPKDRCADDKEKLPPSETAPNDFVELYHSACTIECSEYRVRVYRNGQVEWHGKKNVAVKSDLGAQISPEAVDKLFTVFISPTFWAACSAEPPSPDQDSDADDFQRGEYITATIHGHTKSVDAASSFDDEDAGAKYAWTIDKAADTHHWRHGDAATEPYTNMMEDLWSPKPGVTVLMRATRRFNLLNAEQTLAPLKHFIAKGVDLDAADESGWTALMYAAQLNVYDDHALNLLLDAHAGVNRASYHGDTALMISAYNGVLNEALLDRGADINARNADGVTVLMLLAQHGSPDDLEKALAAKADANAHDSAGHTALDYLRATSCGKPLLATPKQWAQFAPKEPPPCPSTTESFLKSQTLLQHAMTKPPPH